MIRHLKHNEIDKIRWDECIRLSDNGLIYACSWYLDVVCPQWEALVQDDYQYVMPLPVNKRFGIAYLYTPLYAQQLGIFGKGIPSEQITEFLGHIPDSIRLWDIKLNEQNIYGKGRFTSRERKNFTLDISSPYETVRSGYNRNCRRNIRKAEESGLQEGEGLSAHDFALFVRQNLKDQIHDLDRKAVGLLESVTGEALKRKSCEIVTLQDAAGSIHAAGSFLFYKERVIFSVCASTSEGKEQHAMSMLVDQQIRKYAGTYDLFDFSGSEIEGIAYFNAGFGATEAIYPLIHLNRLNWVLRVISGKIN